MAGLAETLRELYVSNGLDMAAVVSADGLVVDAASNPDIDVDSICSVAANGLLMMDALREEIGEARSDLVTLEYPGHIVVLAPLHDDYLLVLLAAANMNLGRIRIVLKRKWSEIAQSVDAV